MKVSRSLCNDKHDQERERERISEQAGDWNWSRVSNLANQDFFNRVYLRVRIRNALVSDISVNCFKISIFMCKDSEGFPDKRICSVTGVCWEIS